MLKKTLTYETIDGEKVTEDFYFHMSKADLLKLMVSKEGGFEAYVQRVVQARDIREAIAAIGDILDLSYGRKTADGKGFEKSPEILSRFKSLEAYSDLYLELALNPEQGAEFVRAIMPKNLEGSLPQNVELPSDKPATPAIPPPVSDTVAAQEWVDTANDPRPTYMKEDRDPTPQELQKMSEAEIAQAMSWLQRPKVLGQPEAPTLA